MATTGSLARYFKAAKAAGKPVQPWEYEAASKSSLESDMANAAANRALATSQAAQAETEKYDTASIEQQVLNRTQTQSIADADRAAAAAAAEKAAADAESAGKMQMAGQLGATGALYYALKQPTVTPPTPPYGTNFDPSTWTPKQAKLYAENMPTTEYTKNITPEGTPTEGGGPITPEPAPQAPLQGGPGVEADLSEGPATIAARKAYEEQIATESGQITAGTSDPVVVNAAGRAAAEGAPEAAGAGVEVGSSVTAPLGYIGAALAAKKLWGGGDIPWDEKTTVQKSTTAPGLYATPFNPLIGKILGQDEDSTFGKVEKTLAQGEETVIKPIEEIVNTVADVAQDVWHTVTSCCILFSRFYGKDSEEVKNAKVFVQEGNIKYDALIGYYQLGKMITDFCHNHQRVKRIVKRFLISRFAEYVRCKVRKTKPRLTSTILSKSYLLACVLVSRKKKLYIPHDAGQCLSDAARVSKKEVCHG
jgi:hypothetical protein